MITKEQLLDQTDRGLKIVTMTLTEQGCKGVDEKDPKKKFKLRAEDKTPSACLYLYKRNETDPGEWGVTDFGNGGFVGALDLYMNNHPTLTFYQCIQQLASIFGVVDELNRSVNKPERREEPAGADEKEGTRVWKWKEFTDDELKTLGPNVTQNDVEALHWRSCEWIYTVRDGKRKYKCSTPTYPIFMRICIMKAGDAQGNGEEVFYKIYEPMNPDKAFRFSCYPSGKKSYDFINGLEELRRAWVAYNQQLERDFSNDPANEGKTFVEQKLPEAFICAGERDSLCLHSLGYHPVWLNSETYKLKPADVSRISKYCETLYNIPDIDTTGKREGVAMALQYLDIHTIWLPEWLRDYKDNRGRPRKDFRDWLELKNRRGDFKSLLNLAMPARFWETTKNQKTGKFSYQIDTSCLLYFLGLNGFYALHDDNTDDVIYVRVEGSIVRRIMAKDISVFLNAWALKRELPREIRNLIYDSTKTSNAAMQNLPEVSLDFKSYTATSQCYYFEDKTLVVTGNGIEERDGGAINTYVWKDSVITHPWTRLDDMFTISRTQDENGRDRWHARINYITGPDGPLCPSNLFGYVINTSRLHWKKELEDNWTDEPEEQRLQYWNTHRFCIDGQGLSEKEIAEQEQNLANKIFAIGYMMHHYKSMSRAWAPLAMDNRIGDDGQCNGRSGKSFLFDVALRKLLNVVKLQGRNPKLMENQFVFEAVTEHTDMVLVDDCSAYLQLGLFYDSITGQLNVNPKHSRQFTIPFDKAPKFAFTTNFVPTEFSASSEARMLYMVFSDYYHQASEDNAEYYRGSWSIRDDFRKELFTESYSAAEWNQDINFLMQCLRFYLSVVESGVKIQPPMENILFRKYKADMGPEFEQWANTYFAKPEDGESDVLDHFILREDLFNAYKMSLFQVPKNLNSNRFKKMLVGFVKTSPYIECLNPAEFKLDKYGRVIRQRREKPDNELKTREYFYLKTFGTPLKADLTNASGSGEQLPANRPADADIPLIGQQPQAVQQSMLFDSPDPSEDAPF